MKPVTRFLGILVMAGLAGCTSSEPLRPPAGMTPAASLHENPNKPGAWIYRLQTSTFGATTASSSSR